MALFMEIGRIVLPIVIVGAIMIFVIIRLKYKLKQGKLGKKKSIGAQVLLDSLMPLGMLFGGMVGIILSLFFSFSLLSALTFGPTIGFLLGYFAYELYSKKEEVKGDNM